MAPGLAGHARLLVLWLLAHVGFVELAVHDARGNERRYVMLIPALHRADSAARQPAVCRGLSPSLRTGTVPGTSVSPGWRFRSSCSSAAW